MPEVSQAAGRLIGVGRVGGGPQALGHGGGAGPHAVHLAGGEGVGGEEAMSAC